MNGNVEGLSAELKAIGELPFAQMDIPSYQRPYRWTEENVFQLLQDMYVNRSEYRIGSLILHRDNECGNEKLLLVDGQQRVTTLILILSELGWTGWTAFQAKYSGDISQETIKSNKNSIHYWVSHHLPTEEARRDYLSHILKECKVTFIVVDNLAEAFQMFDSQNGHGKELLPYNLLKAYHIRAMDLGSNQVKVTDAKIKYDRRWEKAAKYRPENRKGNESLDLLSVMTQKLYDIRQWSRQNYSEYFDKTKIKEFKGIQLGTSDEKGQSITGYGLAALLLSQLLPNLEELASGDAVRSLLSVDMPIINGQAFFEYMQKYVEIFKILFVVDAEETKKEYPELSQFRDDYDKYSNYPTNRSGDRYVRELYQSLVIAVFDKFGPIGVEQTYKTLYTLAYRIRLQETQVKQVTVYKAPIKWFSAISSAYKLTDLRKLDEYAAKQISCKRYEKTIIEYLLKNSVSIIAEGPLYKGNEVIFNAEELITLDKVR